MLFIHVNVTDNDLSVGDAPLRLVILVADYHVLLVPSEIGQEKRYR